MSVLRSLQAESIEIIEIAIITCFISRLTSERWHPLPGAPRRNRVKCSSKEGHVNSRRGSGLSSRALFAALLV